MKEFTRKIGLMPVHATVMCLAALVSFVCVFVPVFEVYVQYVPRRVFSLFTMLADPKITVQLRETTVKLSFLSFGARVFVLSIIISVAALTLALGYQLYTDNGTKKRIGCLTVMLLFIIRLVLHIYTLSNFISPEMRGSNGLSSEQLYVSQTLVGNILCVVLFIGAAASLYGALGLRMKMKMLSYPYILWIVVFTVLPLMLIVFRAFFAKVGGHYEFTTGGFATLLADKTVETEFYGIRVRMQEYFSVFLRSLDYAVWTTLGCLLIAYPLAYILAGRAKRLHKSNSLLLMFFVLPMWMNTMLRTYAWRAFFGQTGVLNTFLEQVNLIDSPIMFLKNDILSDIITKLVLVNDFLPFMLLPIYSVLVKLDDSLSQASHDLGADSVKTFTRVVFPLSLPGVIAGIQMVFMPSLTFYMIPDIISEGSVTTIGNTVQSFILNESATYQQAGNVLSLMLLIFVLFTMGILRNQDKDAGSGGDIL